MHHCYQWMVCFQAQGQERWFVAFWFSRLFWRRVLWRWLFATVEGDLGGLFSEMSQYNPSVMATHSRLLALHLSCIQESAGGSQVWRFCLGFRRSQTTVSSCHGAMGLVWCPALMGENEEESHLLLEVVLWARLLWGLRTADQQPGVTWWRWIKYYDTKCIILQ